MYIYQILCSFGLGIVGIYLRDGPFESDIGKANLQPSKGTRCVVFINENYFDSYGCSLQKLSKFNIKIKWTLFLF